MIMSIGKKKSTTTTTKKGKETEKSRDYSKRKEELYDRRTIRGIPTPRPIKKSSLAQIF